MQLFMFKPNKEYLEKEIMNYFTCIQYDQFEIILSKLFNQSPISSYLEYYSHYVLNLKDYKITYYLNDTKIINNTTSNYPYIYLTDEDLIFRMIENKSLLTYLKKSTNRFVFIPILLSCKKEYQLAHQTILTIDIDKNKAYLIDPNGQSNFLDKYAHLDTPIENLINSLIRDYLKQINIEFISSRVWNHDDIWINKNNCNLCVPTSLLLTQYIYETNLEPDKVIQKFKNIEEKDLFKLIYIYTNNLYDIIK